MFALNQILVPVDFSDRCAGAVRYASSLARHYGSEVTLLHVVPNPVYGLPGIEYGGPAVMEVSDEWVEEIRRSLNCFGKNALEGVNVRRVVLKGDPPEEIVKFAHEAHATTIVMPTHGYGPVRRFLIGSVTAKVLHDCDCAVLTGVHMDKAPLLDPVAFREVVCALDLGPHSATTLEWAGKFAADQHARLRIIHTVAAPEPKFALHLGEDWREEVNKVAREEIQRLQTEAGTKGIVYIEDGNPASEVCSLAEAVRADLLVIGRSSWHGSHGRLRSNSYAIIRQSPCAVASV
jgi:nucleotide-binding universal stress UspA family protein